MTEVQQNELRKPGRQLPNPPTTGRQMALAVLDQYQTSSTFVGKLLDEIASVAETGDNPQSKYRPTAHRRFASELVHGIVRRRMTLDTLIQGHLNRPRERVEGQLWTLLQIGTYQLVFMDSVPSHAAVHETVELSEWLKRQRWKGFLNGVLRSIERSLTDEIVAEPAMDAVPISNGRFRKLNHSVFCDHQQDRCSYMSSAFSLPRWLLERWEARRSFEELLRLGFWFNAAPQFYLRVNRLRATRADVLAALADASVLASPVTHPDVIRLNQGYRISELPGFQAGLYTVQDASAISACDLLAPRPGESILDLCAAPGTKTTCLAERMQNHGQIIAADVSRERLEQVKQNSRRLGIDIIRTRQIQGDGGDVPLGPFDAILVDVPCSNTGVLSKRPEARWRISPAGLTELVGIQTQLLSIGLQRLKPGARIVYSTCSIEPEENQGVVSSVGSGNRNLQLMDEIHHDPGNPADGGYQALLCRTIVS